MFKALIIIGSVALSTVAFAKSEIAKDESGNPVLSKNGNLQTVGQLASRSRMKECGTQWKASDEKKNHTETWPAYWSECNTRMKASDK